MILESRKGGGGGRSRRILLEELETRVGGVAGGTTETRLRLQSDQVVCDSCRWFDVADRKGRSLMELEFQDARVERHFQGIVCVCFESSKAECL